MTAKSRTRRRFGAMEKLPSGRWRASYMHEGQRHYAECTFATKTDASRYLAGVETDIGRNGWHDPRLGRELLRVWAGRFMPTMSNLKPKTIAGYESLLKAHILPTFGDRALSAIKPSDVRAWLANMEANRKGNALRRQALGLLGQLMAGAVADKLILTSPCAGIDRPPPPKPRQDYFTTEEIDRLAAATPDPYRPLVYVLAYGALRIGEAAALRVGRCDLLHSQLHVVENLVEVHGKLEWGTPKTHQARAVAIPRFVADMLATHIEALPRNDPDALVFTDTRGGPLRYSNWYKAVWLPALEAAKLKSVGTHAGRRSGATLLLAAGADVKDVQAQLGHSSATMTLNVYCQPVEGKRDRLVERLNQAWTDARAESAIPRMFHGAAEPAQIKRGA